MKTYLIRLVQESGPTPLGNIVVDWISTPPILATANRLRRVQFEWAGGAGLISEKSMASLRRRYPLTVYWHDARTGRGRELRSNAGINRSREAASG